MYYEPGSFQAQLCVRGEELPYKCAKEHSIPQRQMTKLIVCTEPWQLLKLEQLKSTAHQTACRRMRQNVALVQPSDDTDARSICLNVLCVMRTA